MARRKQPGTFAYIPGVGFADIAGNHLTFTKNFARGEVLFFDVATRAYVVVGLGDGPALITEGYGGWNKVDRPRRYSLTQWQGLPDWTVSIPIIFDGLITGGEPENWQMAPGAGHSQRRTWVPVESEIRTLEALARPAGDQVEPPKLIVDARGVVPHDFQHSPKLRWVISGIDWTSELEIRRHSDGKRVRAGATVELFCVVSDEVLHDVPPSQRHQRRKGGRKHNHYVPIHKGDTLHSIAAKNDTTVKRLRELNQIRDAKHWLRTHTQILVGPPKGPNPGQGPDDIPLSVGTHL